MGPIHLATLVFYGFLQAERHACYLDYRSKDPALAKRFLDEFHKNNTWITEFYSLPRRDKMRFIGTLSITFLYAKQANAFHAGMMSKVFGLCKNGMINTLEQAKPLFGNKTATAASYIENFWWLVDVLFDTGATTEGETVPGIKMLHPEKAKKIAGKNRNFSEIDPKYAKVRKRLAEIDSIRGLVKRENLPTKGQVRYLPPKRLHVGDGLPFELVPKKGGGETKAFIDRFGNKWVQGDSRTAGQPREWDVQLSPAGVRAYGNLTRDNEHLNVSFDGKVTHK